MLSTLFGKSQSLKRKKKTNKYIKTQAKKDNRSGKCLFTGHQMIRTIIFRPKLDNFWTGSISIVKKS